MHDGTLCTDVEIEMILNKYSNMVYRLALARTKHKSDAEDILQAY